MKLEAAREIVMAMVEILRPYCERIEIGGSIRRGNKTDVKDAEIVAIPKPDLLSFMDELVASGAVEKALYGETKTTRWGASYRGMLYQDLKVEAFMADADNWGYIYWLRSGPGDANEYIMRYLSWKNAPIRFREGYAWFAEGGWQRNEKQEWVASNRVKLRVATEVDMFTLLGMPYIPPERRDVERYKMLLGNNPQHEWPSYLHFYAPEPEIEPEWIAALLFQDEGAAQDVPPANLDGEALKGLERQRQIEAEREYARSVMARHEAIFERVARGEVLQRWEARIVQNRQEIEGARCVLSVEIELERELELIAT